MTHVLIRGDGVAARTCAHLLNSAGCSVSMEPGRRSRLPAIMLTDSTLALIRDVFGSSNLFSGAHQIHRRMVVWGHEQRPLVFGHSAIVVSEEELLTGLGTSPSESNRCNHDWTICSTQPLPFPAVEQRFGSRRAVAARVAIRDDAPSGTCITESLEFGWLFLIPSAGDSGWLLSTGAAPEEALAQSRWIAQHVAGVVEQTGEFFTAPRIVDPLYGAQWIACGTAAIGFDPLCGDGTAHAIREAVLAAAVIRRVSDGANADDLLDLYASRLIAGFRRHLIQCHNFYRTGHSGAWWTQELNSLEQGLEWCTQKLSPSRPLQYRLNGFELEAIA